MSHSLAERLRRRISARNVTSILIFGAIVMVFVFFGLPGKMGIGMGSVARVNETLISLAEFQKEEQRVQKMQEYYAQMLGQPSKFDPEQQKDIRRQAVQRLVNMELLSQAGHAQGITATNTEIVDQIRQIPEFQQNGHFQSDLYFRLLEANRLNAAEFESSVRKQVEQTRTQKIFEIAAVPNQLEVEQQKALKEIKWNVAYVKLNSSGEGKASAAIEAEAKKSLTDPEFLKRVEDEYKANIQEYTQKEQVKAQHILVSFKNGDTDAEKKALEKVRAIKERTTKEDFGKLAAELSDDPGSKAKKGDLGFFSRGKMVPEFETAAFAAKVGEVSEPVKSQFGYHLIKVNEKISSSLEEQRMNVAVKILTRDALDKKLKIIEEHLQQGNESALNAELASLGLAWQETGYFELGADMIPKLSGEGVSSAVFRLSAKKPLSQQIVRSGGEKYILKLKDSKKETVASSDADKDTLKQQQAAQMLESWVENYRRSATIEINNQVLQ